MKCKRVSASESALEEDLSKVKSKPLKSKQKKSAKKALKKKKAGKVKKLSLDPETVSTSDGLPNSSSARGVPKIRRSATSENVEENYLIVPWSSREEWDGVCLQLHARDYKEAIHKIAVWQKRVPSLPIGVEATLFLLEALVYDEKFVNSAGVKGLYTEDQARSLYSLAIIRYLNHVSQLAAQSLSGPSKRLTRELTSIVDTPEWLVSLRNDVSHGSSAPSIEVLRMGGDFVLQWLKERYWKLPVNAETSEPSLINDPFTVLSNNEDLDVSSRISELLAAYIAARIYKMRKQNIIRDPDVTRYIPSLPTPVKSKLAIMTLKVSLREYFISHPTLFIDIVSQEMVPNLEFFEDFKMVVKCREDEDRNVVAFNKFAVLWMPIIKLVDSKGKLMPVLRNLARIVTDNEYEKSWIPASKWIDKILELIESSSGKKYTKHLVGVLETTVKHPNSSMHHFLERLFSLTEPRLGSEAVQKLSYLTSIWIDEHVETMKKKKKSTGTNFFKVEDINTSIRTEGESVKPQIKQLPNKNRVSKSTPSSFAWNLDERSEEFWLSIPLGGLL